MIKHYETFDEFRESVLKHEDGFVIAADNPLALRIGFVCAKCGEGWQLPIANLRDGSVGFDSLLALRDSMEALPKDDEFATEFARRRGLCIAYAEAHACPATYTSKKLISANIDKDFKFGWLCLGCESYFTLSFGGKIDFKTARPPISSNTLVSEA